ncbi:hypothetical protein EDD18DRAFT_1344868 [Armillaria luteobubalina]|uniref:DUF6534 domain-containing protein n=1 Tax=Armillaria luteobubalina TaxID=153913 RepID=A0AA39QLF3_9AGAR|nr:hypothetical protein EDD18DRAFT_1344868 [Armillaria luteobubalina]
MKTPAEVAHGPMLIGFVFNVLLYGIMIAQVYLYYVTYKKDKTWMKAYASYCPSVAVIFFADSLNTVFDFVYMYRSLIVHFGKLIITWFTNTANRGLGDVAFLGTADWVFGTDPALTGIIAAMVQVFFAWRVKVLTNNHWFVSIITLASLAGGSGGIATAVEVGLQPRFILFRNFKSVVILWLASECFADIFITVIMGEFPIGFSLRKHKTGFRASDELIDRVIRLTMQTGLMTSICATLDLIFYLVDPTGTHLIFNFPLCKLYTNSMMSSLNSRGGWKFGGDATRGSQDDSLPHVMSSTERHKPDIVRVETHEMEDCGEEEAKRRRSAMFYSQEQILSPLSVTKFEGT